MAHEKKEAKEIQPRPLDARVDHKEHSAAERFVRSVGSLDRAIAVLTQFSDPNYRKPSASGKGDPRVAELRKLATPKRRPEVTRDAAGYFRALEDELRPTLDAVRRKAGGEAGEESLQSLLTDAYTVGRHYLTDRQSHALSHDPLAVFAEMQRMVNELLVPEAPTVASAEAVEEVARV
jgi:hypothetical protein